MRRLDRQTAQRIGSSVTRFAETEHGDIRHLSGREAEYRLRVGGWRVLLTFDHSSHTLTIEHVLPHGRAYRS